jgi:nucleotide-binding universal stress UspA family protein
MYQKVLVPLDGSGLAECILPHLETIAGGCGVKEVVLLRVVIPFHAVYDYLGGSVGAPDPDALTKEAEADAGKYLEQLAEKLKYPGVKVSRVVMKGNEADNIADYAKNNSVDLIIIATHGRSGISRWVWGSVADRVLRSACVPVLMVRAPGCIPGV